MNRLSYSFYRSILWLWDWITLNLAFLFLDKFIFREINYAQVEEYQLFFYVFNAAWLASVFVTALYLSKNWLDFVTFFKRTGKCYLFTILGVLLFI